MDVADAVALVREAVGSGPAGTWADLGAGTGTFSRALARILGADGRVLALDRDRRALETLRTLAERGGPDGSVAPVETVSGDLTGLDAVPALREVALDGVLFANALHYLARPAAPLAWAAGRVRPGGRVVVVEYERERPNPWVPHPLPVRRLRRVLEEAGLPAPTVTARRPSAYHREMYCAFASVPEGPARR